MVWPDDFQVANVGLVGTDGVSECQHFEHDGSDEGLAGLLIV